MDLRLCLFLLATTVAKPQGNISPDCSLETDEMCDSDSSGDGQGPSDDGQEQSVESVELDQTIPKILIVGATGSGKSSMANSLLGLDPTTEGAMFPVCTDMDSCTKKTTYATGKWLGYGDDFIVVDTPGLQDSDNQDNQLIREMVDVLKNKVKTVDCIVLLIEGTTERFHAGLTTQLRQIITIFGKGWWDFLLIGVSKWKYDANSIKDREHACRRGKKSCKDEKWFKRNILHQLEKKFHQIKPFEFAFIHAYSQIYYKKNDESEQKYWKEETDKLWSFVTSRTSKLELKGVDDILEDNRRLKRQVEEYKNTIDTDIANLKGEIQTIKETHNSELNQLKDDTLGEIQTIKETHNSELNQLKYNTLVNKEELTQSMKTNKQDLTMTLQTNKQELTTKLQTNKQELDLLRTKETKIQEEQRNLNSVFRKDMSTNKEKVTSLHLKIALMEKDISSINKGNLNSVFKKDISTNKEEVASLHSKLALVDKDISSLNKGITQTMKTNKQELSKTMQTNKQELSKTMQTNKQELSNTLQTNKQELKSETQMIKETHYSELNQLKYDTLGQIGTTNQKIEALGVIPVGTIIAWVNKPYKDTRKKGQDNVFLEVPYGWMKCDGGTITKGIWTGYTVPDLNGDKRFLRGGPDKDTFKMEEDTLRQHQHDVTVGYHTHNVYDAGHHHSYIDRYMFKGDPCACNSGAGGQANDKRTTYQGKADIRESNGRSSVTVNNILGVPDANRGTEETKPKNMCVIYIMKVF